MDMGPIQIYRIDIRVKNVLIKMKTLFINIVKHQQANNKRKVQLLQRS